jgi:predicted Zn-dependent peptidase
MGIYTFTRVEKVGETVEQTLRTYREFVKDGVTEDEVKTVKALMRGQFPRMFETPEFLARQLLILDRYNIPDTYLTDYYAHLDAITRDSINLTIHKYFDPQNLRILVYAPAKATEASLKKLGKLEVKDYRDYLQ